MPTVVVLVSVTVVCVDVDDVLVVVLRVVVVVDEIVVVVLTVLLVVAAVVGARYRRKQCATPRIDADAVLLSALLTMFQSCS